MNQMLSDEELTLALHGFLHFFPAQARVPESVNK